MMKNSMINGSIEDFIYNDFFSVDDVLAEEESLVNHNSERDLFFEPPISSSITQESDSHQNSDIYSDLVLDYISQMLMEEDMDEKFDMLESNPALEATEKPFYEIIGEKYPPLYTSPPSSDGSETSDLLPAIQFEKGVEEALKFLPTEHQLRVDFPHVKQEDLADTKGRTQKIRHHDINFDFDQQRSSKQSAISYDDEPIVSSEMFDMVLLCSNEKLPEVITTIREAMHSEAASKNPPEIGERNRKSRSKKKQQREEIVDLQTILIHCSQNVASGDHQRAHELLTQIRRHSSPYGNSIQRLAHYFADGLEARLAGTGSLIYKALVSKRKTASDVLKAYQLYLVACPLKMFSYHFSNQTILNTIGNATRVHILDYGIYFGFQWPPFLKMLSCLPGGPPKLRITGIDVPQPGFRPAEIIEETGRRLHHYAERFGVPFEYRAVAAKLDEVRVEDLDVEEDEVLIVNCVFRMNCIGDETMDIDCPRDRFLNKLRELNPALFVNVTSNGSFGAPFFVTRFREALYHFSALFDMLEMTVPREHEQRMLVERDLYGKQAVNVISCEGGDRLVRPETYKQTQVRCLRAGFEQLSISSQITKMVKREVRVHYHKDFSVDEDGRWLLLGWRGRIFIGLSAWKPRDY